MTNRRDLALAVTAGYVLGRMQKAKLAVGVGSLLLGKRINLSPGQLAEVLSKQISANPQLAEIRDQLRGELQGAGKSVRSALVTRQLDTLSHTLREKTLDIRDRLSTVPLTGRLSKDGEEKAERSEATGEKPESDAYEARGEAEESRPRRESPAKKAPAKKAPVKRTAAKETTAKKAPTKKVAPAGKKTASAAKKTASSAGKKTASSAKKTAPSSRRTSSRGTEGGNRG